MQDVYHSTDSAYFVKSTPSRAFSEDHDPFNTLEICYRHIVDVHEELICRKNIFEKFTAFLTQPLYIQS